MEIRTAISSDVPGLVALWEEFMDFHSGLDPSFCRSEGAASRWAEYISSKLNDETNRVLVASDGETLAGYLVAVVRDYPPISTVKHFGLIQEIAVCSKYRRQGIGRQLVGAAEEWLKSAGVPQVEVKIDVTNEASQRLFRSEGFVRCTETLIKRYDAGA